MEDPRWDQRDGYRVAYRSGGWLRVVSGDGTGDHAAGVVKLRDLDTGDVRWRHDLHHPLVALAWSPDGRRLVAVARDRITLLSGVSGAPLVRWRSPAGARNVTAAWSPLNDRYAVLRQDPGGRWRILLSTPGTPNGRHRPTGPLRRTTLIALPTPLRGLLWSPDGRWLLTASPREDHWLFTKPGANGRMAAVLR